MYILVEGDDDQRFFERILSERLQSKYTDVKFWKYRQTKADLTLALIRSLNDLDTSYVVVGDIDNAPCISGKKQNLMREFNSIRDPSAIAVVVMEIESWYLAGLSNQRLKWLGFKKTGTNGVTKEEFEKLKPKVKTRVEFMIENLQDYQVNRGVARNSSFAHFVRNWT